MMPSDTDRIVAWLSLVCVLLCMILFVLAAIAGVLVTS